MYVLTTVLLLSAIVGIPTKAGILLFPHSVEPLYEVTNRGNTQVKETPERFPICKLRDGYLAYIQRGRCQRIYDPLEGDFNFVHSDNGANYFRYENNPVRVYPVYPEDFLLRETLARSAIVLDIGKAGAYIEDQKRNCKSLYKTTLPKFKIPLTSVKGMLPGPKSPKDLVAEFSACEVNLTRFNETGVIQKINCDPPVRNFTETSLPSLISSVNPPSTDVPGVVCISQLKQCYTYLESSNDMDCLLLPGTRKSLSFREEPLLEEIFKREYEERPIGLLTESWIRAPYGIAGKDDRITNLIDLLIRDPRFFHFAMLIAEAIALSLAITAEEKYQAYKKGWEAGLIQVDVNFEDFRKEYDTWMEGINKLSKEAMGNFLLTTKRAANTNKLLFHLAQKSAKIRYLQDSLYDTETLLMSYSQKRVDFIERDNFTFTTFMDGLETTKRILEVKEFGTYTEITYVPIWMDLPELGSEFTGHRHIYNRSEYGSWIVSSGMCGIFCNDTARGYNGSLFTFGEASNYLNSSGCFWLQEGFCMFRPVKSFSGWAAIVEPETKRQEYATLSTLKLGSVYEAYEALAPQWDIPVELLTALKSPYLAVSYTLLATSEAAKFLRSLNPLKWLLTDFTNVVVIGIGLLCFLINFYLACKVYKEKQQM